MNLIHTVGRFVSLMSFAVSLFQAAFASELVTKTHDIRMIQNDTLCQQKMGVILNQFSSRTGIPILSRDFEMPSGQTICRMRYSFQKSQNPENLSLEFWQVTDRDFEDECSATLEPYVTHYSEVNPNSFLSGDCQQFGTRRFGSSYRDVYYGYFAYIQGLEETIQLRSIFVKAPLAEEEKIGVFFRYLRNETSHPVFRRRGTWGRLHYFAKEPVALQALPNELSSEVFPQVLSADGHFDRFFSCVDEVPFFEDAFESMGYQNLVSLGCQPIGSIDENRLRPLFFNLGLRSSVEEFGHVAFPETFSSRENCHASRWNVIRNFRSDQIEISTGFCLKNHIQVVNGTETVTRLFLFGRRK